MAKLRKFLVTEAAVPFVQNGIYVFQVGFGYEVAGQVVRCNYRRCPYIKVQEGDVLATTNAWAAQLLEAMLAPNKTERAGKRRAVGKINIFSEVTASTEHQHDLDAIFAPAIEARKESRR